MNIPCDVPATMRASFIENYETITKKTDNLFIFAADQKIEHLHQNFYGPHIHPDAGNPRHLFEIAAHGTIGVFATHLGLIARYGQEYPSINYLVKLNGKTNIIQKQDEDPLSRQLWSVEDVISFKKNSGLNIRGIGYTIYLGSKHEAVMLHEAAQAVLHAHQHGLVAVLWMYPRGIHVKNEYDGMLLAGAAGVAASLGADFAKINAPQAEKTDDALMSLKIAQQAAGTTKLVCAGGVRSDEKNFFSKIYDQIHIGSIGGAAVGRNIYQHSLPQAIACTQALSALIYESKTVEEALNIYKK